jgi:NAD(P)-dependent dehydrogenase (short-subunit alcohol dehydrogenase family)
MSTVLIVGASRGIGFEFARQYAADGARVIASHRKPDDGERLRALGARPLALDVRDADAIAALGKVIGTDRIDLAVLVAGIYGPRTSGLAAPDPADFDAVMHTNVRAPMLLIPVLAPLLAAARGKLVVLSSRMGATGTMSQPTGWLYRASKAALNNVLKSASLALGSQGVTCMAFHPGWVRTDMGGAGADIEVAESVTRMRYVIAAANESHNGKFLNYSGEQLSW